MFNKIFVIGALFVGYCIAMLYGMNVLPENAQIPVHWGLEGNADRFVDKWPGLLMMPGIALMVGVLLWVLPKIDPRKQHIAESKPYYYPMMMVLQAVFLCIYILSILSAKGEQFDVAAYVVAGIGIVFMVLGNYLPKIRSNFFIGIRTPWTLSSEQVWQKTHRLGGFTFFTLGIVMTLGNLFLAVPAMFKMLAILVFVAVVWIYVASWYWFKQEQSSTT